MKKEMTTMGKAVTAYKSTDGKLWETEEEAIGQEALKAIKEAYLVHSMMELPYLRFEVTDIRPLYELLKGFYDG
jgi:hypothetical protein